MIMLKILSYKLHKKNKKECAENPSKSKQIKF